jgi:hypothetical protein
MSFPKYRTKAKVPVGNLITYAFDDIILYAETEIGIVEMGANYKK